MKNYPENTPIEARKAKGQFVRRKQGASKVYQCSGFNRFSRKYELIDMDDFCRVIEVKPSCILYTADI